MAMAFYLTSCSFFSMSISQIKGEYLFYFMWVCLRKYSVSLFLFSFCFLVRWPELSYLHGDLLPFFNYDITLPLELIFVSIQNESNWLIADWTCSKHLELVKFNIEIIDMMFLVSAFM